MKEKIKTAVCALMVTAIALSSFGCKKEETKQTLKTQTEEKPKEKTEQKEEKKKPETVTMEGTSSPKVEVTVSDFMDAYLVSDIEKASKLYYDSKDALDMLKSYNLNDFMQQEADAYAMDPALAMFAPQVIELAGMWYPEAVAQSKYEITEVKVKSGNYIATVELKTPDFGTLIPDAEIKIAEMLVKEYNLTENMTDAQIRQALGISPTDTPEQASTILNDVLKKIMDECKENITEDVSHIEKATYELEFYVVQKNKKWLINSKRSDISDLDKLHKKERPAQPVAPATAP